MMMKKKQISTFFTKNLNRVKQPNRDQINSIKNFFSRKKQAPNRSKIRTRNFAPSVISPDKTSTKEN